MICFWLHMRKNESLHVAIHTTTENKIAWGNREYDVKMVFSETILKLICMGGNAKKQSIKGKQEIVFKKDKATLHVI